MFYNLRLTHAFQLSTGVFIMGLFKKIIAGTAATIALTAAQAAPITVGGVVWDPDAATDFTSQSINIRQFINNLTGELTGYGILTAINGSTEFCAAANCQLTFQFGGFMPTGTTVIPTAGSVITYAGGVVDVYVGDTRIANPADYNSLDSINTKTDTKWLSLENNSVFTGTSSAIIVELSGLGTLDVTGGLAAANFDTNTLNNGTDLAFTSSFSFPRGNFNDMSGTGNFYGNTVVAEIPEPATLALMGIGLLGFAASRRRAQGESNSK